MSKHTEINNSVILQNPKTGEQLPITNGFIIGRTEGNKSYPEDKLLSRQHCMFSIIDDEVFIEDLGSTNKTRLNGKELKPKQKYKMDHGNLLQIGNLNFVLHQKKKKAEASLIIEHFSTNDMDPSLFNASDADMESRSRSNIVLSSENTGVNALIDIDLKKTTGWSLQVDGAEYGPLTLTEVQNFIKTGRYKGNLFIFHDQLENWTPIERIKNLVPKQPLGHSSTSSEVPKPENSRVPLVATVSFTLKNGKKSTVCQDVSISEIFISYKDDISEIPSKLTIDVFPLAATGMDPFKVDVTVSEKKVGIGFLANFVNLNAKSRSGLERHIQKRKIALSKN